MKPTKMHMFGHRGSSSSEPENTFSSIQKALQECDGAEFDIQRTKDGHLIVLHDETLARTAVAWSKRQHRSEAEYYSLVNTPITQLNYDEFRDIHVGRAREHLEHDSNVVASDINVNDDNGTAGGVEEEGQKLSSLPDVLDLITKLHPSKQYLVEIKADISSVPLIHRDVIKSGVTPSQVRFIGFGFETMVDIKRILPAFSSIHIIKQNSEEDVITAIYKASEAKLNGVDFEAMPDTVTAKAVSAAHALDMQVLVYVSNKQEDTSEYWERLQENGVDVFTSDLPSPIFEWMAKNIQAKLADCGGGELTPKREVVPGSLIRRLLTQSIESNNMKSVVEDDCISSGQVEVVEVDVKEPPTKIPKCSD